jgi:hypothetical protein
LEIATLKGKIYASNHEWPFPTIAFAIVRLNEIESELWDNKGEIDIPDVLRSMFKKCHGFVYYKKRRIWEANNNARMSAAAKEWAESIRQGYELLAE